MVGHPGGDDLEPCINPSCKNEGTDNITLFGRIIGAACVRCSKNIIQVLHPISSPEGIPAGLTPVGDGTFFGSMEDVPLGWDMQISNRGNDWVRKNEAMMANKAYCRCRPHEPELPRWAWHSQENRIWETDRVGAINRVYCYDKHGHEDPELAKWVCQLLNENEDMR